MRSLTELFATVVVCQLLHSTEEYLFGLYNWFPVITGKINADLPWFPVAHMSGDRFLILNIALAVFLVILYVIIRSKSRVARRIASIVAVIEILNGVLHVSATIMLGAYIPGAGTGAVLAVAAIFLARVSFFSKPLVADAFK